MSKELKTELTRDEVKILLEVYTSIDAMVGDTLECMDIRMSQLRDLNSKACELKEIFDFRPARDDDGRPNQWMPCVLPDDPKAWYYEDGELI